MNVTAPTILRRERKRRRGRQAATPCASTVDAKRGCGCEDQALYTCECGFAWKAEPTTSIGCPHCGTQQAW